MIERIAAAGAAASSEIGYAVARKALDVTEQQGAAAVKLIQDAGEIAQQASQGAVSPAQRAEGAGSLDVLA